MEIVVNYSAVLASAVVMFAVGALWYSPLLFSRLWMKEMGFTEASMKAMKMTPLRAMSINAVVTLISAYVLYHFVALFGVATLGDALGLGFWAWLGFMVPMAMYPYLWEGKSFTVALLSLGQTLVSVCAGAAAIFFM